jgi:hypothetical protein
VTGLVDGSRITGDIHNHWTHVLMNASGVATRWWMHRNLWNNDPDFLIVRTPDNCPTVPLNRERPWKPFEYGQTWVSGREMNDTEVQAYAQLVLMSAGDVMLSDHLPALTESGRSIIRTVLQHRLTRPAVPLDLFHGHGHLPSVWLAEEPGHWMLGLFNWEEDPESRMVDLAKLGISPFGQIQNIWDQRTLCATDGRISVNLPPRSGLAFRIDKQPR